MNDDEILGRILRRFLDDEDEWSSVNGRDLVLDGRIRIDAEEAAAVDRVLRPEPVRQVRLGETFDLAPGERVDIITDDLGEHPGPGPLVVFHLDGGPGGMKGARIG